MKTFLLFVFLGPCAFAQVKLSGMVREVGSQEHIPHAHVSIKTSTTGTTSNAYGFFSLEVPKDSLLEIRFTSIGFVPFLIKGKFKKDTVVNIEMAPGVQELNEVIVTSDEGSMAKGNGPLQLPPSLTKQTPTLLGEKDVLKTLQLLPGVQRGTEGTVALYIRGGGPDQNLIILDDAQVYNANHLFGFFSVFNGDAIKHVEFWKSGFPARYGGKVSSVIDIQMKDGHKEKTKGEGGIGIISSRLTLEGPIKKGHSSFLLSTRRSYLDLLTKPFMPPTSKIGYRFYDLNAKINLDLGGHDQLILSSYVGNDQLNTLEIKNRSLSTIRSENNLGWGNATVSLRWNHVVNKKTFINTTLLHSNFNFHLSDAFDKTGSQPRAEFSEFKSSLRDFSIKSDLDYFASNAHNLKIGVLFTYHLMKPKAYTQQNNLTGYVTNDSQLYLNQEMGVYVEDTWQPGPKFDIQYGVRLNALNTPYKFFGYIEPRLNVSFEILKGFTLNGSYTRANQFIHLLSNTGIGLATDLWVPATLHAPPQQSDQFSFGLTKNLPNPGITISFETYRKYLRNIITYTENASFLILDEKINAVNWENNIAKGKGLAYGNEILLRKQKGKITGWIAYTLSWAIHQFDSLNQGKKFFPKYDSRHNLSTVLTYAFSPKTILSVNWVYSTGNALTVPHAAYLTQASYGGQSNYRLTIVPYFGSRNSFRAEAYHRLDIGIQFHKKKKHYARYWEFGLYNAYNRKNPFYYYLETSYVPGQNGQTIALKKRSLFPVIPSISYNFKF